MSLPTVTVKNSGLFPQSKQWAAVTIQNRLRMEPPHQTGPTCALKSNSTCHGQDPGCASVPPTILGSPILVPGSKLPSEERHFMTMVLDLFFFVMFTILIKLYFKINNNKIYIFKWKCVEMGKNPLKAPRHPSRWKLQPTYNPANIYKKNPKHIYRNSMS